MKKIDKAMIAGFLTIAVIAMARHQWWDSAFILAMTLIYATVLTGLRRSSERVQVIEPSEPKILLKGAYEPIETPGQMTDYARHLRDCRICRERETE